MKVNSFTGNPATDRAAVIALGPGTGTTAMPWSRASREARPRICDGRGPGIGHEGNSLAPLQPFDEPAGFPGLVVFPEADRRFTNLVVREESGGPASVFGGNQIDLAEDAECSET